MAQEQHRGRGVFTMVDRGMSRFSTGRALKPRPGATLGSWEVSTMLHAKQASKRKSRAKSAVLGVAGALSLAGASEAGVGPAGDTPTENTAPLVILEEEISDVSLSTFHVFDKENAGAHPVLQLAQRTRSRPRQARGGCAVDDCAGGGPTCCASCATGGAGCG